MIQNKELSSSALLTCERMVCNVKLQASSSYSHENDQSLLLIFLRSYMFSLEFLKWFHKKEQLLPYASVKCVLLQEKRKQHIQNKASQNFTWVWVPKLIAEVETGDGRMNSEIKQIFESVNKLHLNTAKYENLCITT